MGLAWRHFQRGVVATALVVGSGSVSLAPTHTSAADPESLVCTVAAVVQTVPALNDHFRWTVTGVGSCFDAAFPSRGTQQLTVTGTGTSQGLGLCSPDLVVNNLSINVDITAVDSGSGLVRVFKENWGSPVTTYPVAMPFTVSGSATGAGVIFTHIFAQCPPGGTSSASIEWAELR